jgi:UDP-N-acetyl-D-glucosamine dehydrogenase
MSKRRCLAVVIVTDHKAYDFQAIRGAAQFVFDSRNALGRLGRQSGKVVRL